jgi:ketosteroid isomerase-like protein
MGIETQGQTRQLVEVLYQAFIRGDREAILDLCAENVMWAYYGQIGVPILGESQGLTGVRQFFDSLGQFTCPLSYELKEMIVEEERAVALGSARVLVRATGREFFHQWCHVYTLGHGKIIRFRGFTANPSEMARAFDYLSD